MTDTTITRGNTLPPPQALMVLAKLGLKNSLRGKLVWGCFALLALPLVVLVPLEALGRGLAGKNLTTFFRVWVTTLLPLASILMAYSGVSEEVESQTVTYIHSRPLPRWALPLGKWLTSFLLVAPAACLLLGGGAILTQVTPLDGAFLGGVLLGAATYCALATTAGALVPKHAVLASLGLFALLDMGLANVPGFTQTLAPSFHVETLTALRAPAGALSKIISSAPTSTVSSIMALVVHSVVFILVGVARSTFWEHRRLT